MTTYINRPDETDPDATERDYSALDESHVDAEYVADQLDLDEQELDGESLQSEVASQWRLMWWKFRQHKLAMFSGVVVILFYLTALFCEFVAPTTSVAYNQQYVHAPPSACTSSRMVDWPRLSTATPSSGIRARCVKPGA